MDVGRVVGMVQGRSRISWYDEVLMSEVRVRARRPRASGGKVGMLKSVRGIWAPLAVEGSLVVWGVEDGGGAGAFCCWGGGSGKE